MSLKPPRVVFWIGACVLGAGLFMSMIALVLALTFGSLAAGLAYVRGQQLIVVPRTLDVGSGQENEQRDYRLELVNLSERPVTILGAKSSCGCILVKDELPFKIPAHDSYWLSGTVTFVGESDDLLHSITVYSDLPKNAMVSASIKGRILRDARAK